jgi:hypothetical protein
MFFMNKFKNRKTKRAVEHTAFLKKIAACQSVSQCVCEIVKLSGFERPQKEKKLKKKIFFFNQYFKNFYNSKNTQDGK